MEKIRIPLFPLDLVLFPGNVLPLHIFEPRYKLMIGNVVAQNVPFGVVRAHHNGVARIGCTAIVIRVLKTYEDGRMDIVAVGQRVFSVAEVYQDKPFLEATVELLEDEMDGSAGDSTEGSSEPVAELERSREFGSQELGSRELRSAFEECYRLAHGAAPEPAGETSPLDRNASLAYKLGGEIPLDIDAKQELLEIRSERERQERLLEYIRQLVPQLTRIAQMRQRTAGNGHGLH